MSYWQSTRHPGPCLLFLTPLLFAYEWGVLSLGGSDAASLRNGADGWTRDGLAQVGLRHPVAAPGVVVAVVAVWFWRKRDSLPDDIPSLCLGMAIESVAGAVTLWLVSRAYAPALEYLGLTLTTPPTLNAAAVGQVVTYLGAGIYEEVMFRMVLFGGLAFVLQSALPGKAALVLAALVAALLFAAAHHVGPHGEAMDGFNFLFRTLAGLYFTAVYRLRGFGIAVGSHACYDVLVGIPM
ncbi:MAG: CPBP family glutamic-type intramembrane protease [Gemmataceae bacterium]